MSFKSFKNAMMFALLDPIRYILLHEAAPFL